MTKKKPAHLRTVIVVTLVLLTLFGAFLVFRNRLNAKIQTVEEVHLTESAKAVAEVFYIKLDDQLTMLESQARYFQGIDLTDYNAMKETIMSTKGIGEFKNIGVANSSGATINYNGTSSGNILLFDYYREAMKGNHAISISTIPDEDGDEVLVLAVPLKKGDKTEGVIYGTFTKETLNSIVESITFSDRSSNMLFNRQGKILAKSSGGFIDENAESVTDVIPNVQIPDGEKTASIHYSIKDKQFIALLIPIGIHDWYFTNIIPESVVTNQTTQIAIYVGIMIIVVIFLFIIILLHIVRLVRNNDRIRDINERFRLINNQSHNIIFAYDYKSGTMTVDGNVSHIIAHAKNVYTHADAEECLKLIHEEDAHICQAIHKIPESGESSVQGEFRMKNLDNSYYWYRMNAAVMRDETGKPVQLLGSVFDVDEQRNKEMALMEQASTDSLTGILNKGAFRAKVINTLAGAPAGLALYIIDLDNFKSVNDNLGHAMGDKVLTDVADKLSEIFKSKECVGRIGGDEFAAFYADDALTEKMITERAAQICKRMQETYASYTAEIHVSVSVGAAVYGTAGTDYETLYRNADKALYHVKGNGKNMYALFKEGEIVNET